ncbi:MAG: hypothetical protein IPM81_01145 [Saprospirales bacterium]|nr:hypothetical protein [Saprospirales bacterium]
MFPPFTPADIFIGGIDLPLAPFQFQVVDSVRLPDKEIALQDARIFDKNIGRGATLTLNLPMSKTALSGTIGRRVADLIQNIKPGRPQGIRVQFNNVQIKRLLPNTRRGRIITGTAFYPAAEPIPLPPFTLEIEGFILEVRRLTIFPTGPAEAAARLVLPGVISSGKDCERAVLDLGKINLSPRCEFYQTAALAPYGPLGIGNTTLLVRGTGYVADFSSTTGSAPGGGPASWKGLILNTGETAGEPAGTVYSNTGYLQAHYRFGAATVRKNGFSGILDASDAYTFFSVQPFGYGIHFENAQLEIQNNRVLSGSLNEIALALPEEAVRDRNGAPLAVRTETLEINNELDITGLVRREEFPNIEFFWGEFTHPGQEIMAYGVTNCRAGLLFIPGQYHGDYYPVAGDAFAEPVLSPLTAPTAKALGMTGLTVYNPSLLFIQSPDVPHPPLPYPLGANHLEYKIQSRRLSWFNVQAQGVHAGIYSDYLDRPQELGDPDAPYYAGEIPFRFGNYVHRDKKLAGQIELRYVESAVFHSDVQGGVELPMPTGSNLLIRRLAFTSTAQIAGGEVDLSNPASLAFWGLELVPRPGYGSSGVLSVKTGQIILTAAGLAEKRHFKEPFYLTWGELLAKGTLGRLFFDYHTAGQQFDGFDFTPDAVALSDYPGTAPPPYGFLRVGGTAHFPFFGNNYLHILDHYDPGQPAAPFNSRIIRLETTPSGAAFFASDLTLFGDWADGLGVFDIRTLYYNDDRQDGFLGDGFSSIRTMLGGTLVSSLILQSDHACISFNSGTDVRTLQFAPFSDITQMTQIWGCVCIRDDRIDNVVLGGSLTSSGNTLMVVARTGQHMSAVVRLSPAAFEVTLDGTATLSVALSLDMELSGHLNVKFDVGNQYMEGEVDGYFHLGAAAVTPQVLGGASLTGQGQANWHIGLNPLDGASYQSIQGSISMNVMGVVVNVVPPFTFGSSVGLNAGFYLGVNAPKSDAWVLLGSNPRYQLNMTALPDRLTGVYGFVQIKHDLNLFILSGGYEIFVGVGAFLLTDGQAGVLGGLLRPGIGGGIPYAVGNLGGRIHGEFLGGLVGGAAWINLQLIAPYPFHFEGTIGLEGCVLWVICTTYHFTVGVNSSEGFYIRD